MIQWLPFFVVSRAFLIQPLLGLFVPQRLTEPQQI